MEAGSEAVAFFASEAGMRRMRTWSQKRLKQCPDQAAAQTKAVKTDVFKLQDDILWATHIG
jgi:hypothetical protein